jgi:hypothetical protein
MSNPTYDITTSPGVYGPQGPQYGVYQIDVIGGGGSGSNPASNLNGGGGGGSGLYISFVFDIPSNDTININQVGTGGTGGNPNGTYTDVTLLNGNIHIQAGGGYSMYGSGSSNGANGADQIISESDNMGTFTKMISSGGGGGGILTRNGGGNSTGGTGFNGINNGMPSNMSIGGNGGGISNLTNGNGIGGIPFPSIQVGSTGYSGGGGGGGGILPTVLSDTNKSQGASPNNTFGSNFSNGVGLNYGSGGGGGGTGQSFPPSIDISGNGASGAVLIYKRLI